MKTSRLTAQKLLATDSDLLRRVPPLWESRIIFWE